MPNGLVCAVCARVLNHDSVLGWVHALQDQPEDHPAVPVERSEIHVRGRCDFCSDENPSWSVPARDFDYFNGRGSHGDWAACDTCAQDITRNDWNSVLRRAVALAPVDDKAVYQAGLKMLYGRLRKNITGLPRPLVTSD